MASSRYARQISLPEVGCAGQVKLGKASVLCVGVGGLGNAVVQSLVSAGVGKIVLCDSDEISLSNLARQPLYAQQDIGQLKVNVLVRVCQRLNAEVTITPISEDISVANVEALLCEADIVVDCTDNAEAKYLLNRHCVAGNKPLITASLSQWAGYCMMVHGQGCYRCVFPEENAELPTCSGSGVISTLPALVGQVQASLVLLCLLGLADDWRGKLWSGDLKRQRFGVFDFEADPVCSVCANCREKEGVLMGAQPTLRLPIMHSMTLSELAVLNFNDKVCLLDVRTVEERLDGHMGGQHLPLDQLQGGLSKLDKQKQWVVYCRSGVRSEQACRWMLQAGFSHVSNLLGGYAAWLASQQSA